MNIIKRYSRFDIIKERANDNSLRHSINLSVYRMRKTLLWLGIGRIKGKDCNICQEPINKMEHIGIITTYHN